MKVSNQIRELLKHEDISLTELAAKLNTSQPNLTAKLNRDAFKISDLQEIANALGYEDIEIILRGYGEDAIILEDEVLFRPHGVYLQPDDEVALEIGYDSDLDANIEDMIMLKDLIVPIFEPHIETIFNAKPDSLVPKKLARYLIDGLSRRLEESLK